MKGCGRGWTAFAVAALLVGAASGPALAQPATVPAAVASGDPALRAEYDALFRRIIANPADLEANYRFSEVATKLGDFEAAIGALERLVFYNPSNLPTIRSELGVLYFRLGSYQVARTYFETALAGDNAPPEVTSRSRAFIAEIERRLNPSQLSFYGQAGLRYQTNASAGPSSDVVRILGTDALLDRRFQRRPDWNAFALGAVRHVYDFENERGDVWETNVATYNAKQFQVRRLDVNLLDVQTGPRLGLNLDALPGAYVRPYFIGGVVFLGGEYYLGSFGGGVGFGAAFGNVQVEPFVEARRREFDKTRDYPIAPEQTGTLVSAGVGFGSALAGPVRWQSRLAYSRNETQDRFAYNSYNQFSADLATPFDVPGLLPGERTFLLTPFAGFTYSRYDEPYPLVDAKVTRRDNEWRVGLAVDAPLGPNAGFGAQISYSNIDSNLKNYDQNNLAISFGPTLRF